MRARSGMSVHREDAQRDAEAREAGFADGINAALAWLVADGDANRAARMRAAFVEAEDVEQGRAAG